MQVPVRRGVDSSSTWQPHEDVGGCESQASVSIIKITSDIGMYVRIYIYKL